MSKLNQAHMAYTFDDFSLSPVYSEVKSRKNPNLQTHIKNFDFGIPIVSAPMSTVTEERMAVVTAQLGGVAVVHRYMNINAQIKIAKNLLEKLGNLNHTYFAVSIKENLKERLVALHEAGVNNFCVDVANGHNVNCINAVKLIRREIPDSLIMSGNVCTFEGALKLAEAGSNSIRVGIGCGAVCITRMITGHGIPQLSAIEDCVRIKKNQFAGMCCGNVNSGHGDRHTKVFSDVAIIADGGIRSSSDVVKALAIGADAVMIGSLLAGTEETPGKFLEESGNLFKYYHGMASEKGRESWFAKSNIGLPSEGISIKIPYTGKSAKKVIENLCSSVKVGLSYAGASNLEELRQNAQWIKITQSGYTEGTPHGNRG
jgi:IMP dehydrogenase